MTSQIIKIGYINFWNNNNMWFTSFINENICKAVNDNYNPDILFCSCFGDIKNIINAKAKIKIFFYGENLERFPEYNNFDLLSSIFDLILGFKYTNLNKKILRFPLWIIYYPFYNTHNYNLISYIEDKHKQNSNKEKKMFATLVSNHDRNGQRGILLQEMSKYGFVNCPSRFNNNCPPIGGTEEDKINYISQSKYNICPENSHYEGYFTEKIIQALEGGTIPIYNAIDLPEKDLLNPNKYVFVNIYDNNDVKNKIHYAINNYNNIISDNVFNDNAKENLQKIYDELSFSITSLLIQKNILLN